MHSYEVAVLFHPDLEIDLSKAQSKIEKIFKDNGGKVTDTDNWGKKKLAYSINKQDHAVYVFYTVDLPAESLRKVESALNITDEVIRYLITRVDHKAIAKAEAIRADKAKKAAARQEREDSTENSESEES